MRCLEDVGRLRSLGLVAVVLGLATGGCTATTVPVRHRLETARHDGQRTATPTSSTTNSRRRPKVRTVIDLIAQAGPRHVVLASSPQGGGRVHLFIAAEDGSIRDITPTLPKRIDVPDSAFFLNAAVGWFTAYSGGGGSERLYRTDNGGRTWRSFRAPVHSMGAGSTDELDFVNQKRGWLADIQPTGPGENLFTTDDGGAHWHALTALHYPHGRGALPEVGEIQFAADGRGWLADSSFPSQHLFRTTDGGYHWRRLPLKTRRLDTPAMPGVFGRTVLAPISWCSHGHVVIRLAVSRDSGAHWQEQPPATLLRGANHCDVVGTAVGSRTVAWAIGVADHRLAVMRTADQGKHWEQVTTPAESVFYPPTVLAPSARDAWLLAPDRWVGRLLLTTDGGQHWRLLHVP